MYIDEDISEIRLLGAPDLEPLFWRPTRSGIDSAWTGHIPFASWLVRAIKPRLLVELGTHNGVSYSAFCDAVLRSHLSTRCYAVDTWKGDPHAGEYGEDVFIDFNHFHAAHYAGFSDLLRCTFEQAVGYFSDGSIDLLHVDGYHTYDAVRADFERWKSKCSDRAVVLLHDTNVRSQGFGVWKLFAELSEQYPHFEFLHEHGLGVLAVGSNAPSAIAGLCELTDDKIIGAIRERFALLGERWKSELNVRSLESHAQAIAQHRETLNQHVLSLEQQLKAQGAQHQSLKEQLAKREHRTLALELQIKAQETETERLRAALFAEKEMRSRSAARATSARKALFEARMRLALADDAKFSAPQVSTLQAQLAEKEATISALVAQLSRTQLCLAHTRAAHGTIEGSTTWRATWPLRRLGAHLPAEVRRVLRSSAKLGWWTVTLQLQRHLSARRRIVECGGAAGQLSLEPIEPAPALLAPPAPSAEARGWGPSKPQVGAVRRLIYLSGEPDTAGTVYRVDRYVAAARSLGLDVLSFPLDGASPNLPPLSGEDMIIVWRAGWDPTIEAITQAARQAGALFVFDIDDLLINPGLARISIIDGIRTQGVSEGYVRARFQCFQDTMRAADFCTVTTETLAQEVRSFHKTAFVLPNTFDDALYRASRFVVRWKAIHGDDGLTRIGYAGGTNTHQKDFRLVAPAVADALRARPNCRLVLFRKAGSGAPLVDISEFPALQEMEHQIEWRDAVQLMDLPSEVARFDINLAPLEAGNRFCEAKSELKFFEAAIAGVCTIASPTEPFRTAIRHGRNGYLAASLAEWATYLETLLNDPALRRTVARQAHYDALSGFGPAAARRALASLLEQAAPGERAARAFQLDVSTLERTDRMAIDIVTTSQVFAIDNLGRSDVTIVVPLYNDASCVMEAIESVRLQTLQTLDLVVVDDRSTDNSLDVVVNWARQHGNRFNRLLVLQNERNAGVGLTQNVGFNASETPYVLPLDAANRLLPRCCEVLLRTLNGSAASFAYPTVRKFGESSEVIGPSPYSPKRFVGELYVDAMALVRKEAWAIVRGYADMRTRWVDYDFWCRMAEQGLWGIGVGDLLVESRVRDRPVLTTASDRMESKLHLLRDFEQRHPWTRITNQPVPHQLAAE